MRPDVTTFHRINQPWMTKSAGCAAPFILDIHKMPSKKRMGIKAYTKMFKPAKLNKKERPRKERSEEQKSEHEKHKEKTKDYTIEKALAKRLGCDESEVELEIAKRVEASMPESVSRAAHMYCLITSSAASTLRRRKVFRVIIAPSSTR